MSGITNFECPQCGNKLWKYDHGETIKLECDLLECEKSTQKMCTHNNLNYFKDHDISSRAL